MKLPLWVRRAESGLRDHLLVVVMVLAFVVGVIVPYGVRSVDERSQHERRAEVCVAFQQQQDVTRALIDSVLVAPSSTGAALLAPESFAALPPESQTYLRELSELIPSETRGGSLAERLKSFRDEQLGSDDLPAYCT